MFERLNTLGELYEYRLRCALKMEQTIVTLLEENLAHAQADAVRQLLTHHLEQTHEQEENLGHVFTLLRAEADTAASPALEGLHAEAKATLRKTDHNLRDVVILQGAAELEHHEIAMYENLIAVGRALGREDTVTLLQANLAQEQQALATALSLLRERTHAAGAQWREELMEIAPREDD